MRRLHAAWFNIMLGKLLGANERASQRRSCWVIIDEAHALKHLPALGTALIEARKYKVKMVLGTQNKAQFEEHCVSCHRRDLGGISGPALKGDRFLDQWREFPLDVLLNDMRAQMPLRNPGGLPAGAYVDISAFLLEANGLPSGREELTPDIAASVRFVAPGGPRPLPTSSPAVSTGCMTKEAGTGWFLTSASQPSRTLDPYEFTDSELKAAGQTELGETSFGTVSFQGFVPVELAEVTEVVALFVLSMAFAPPGVVAFPTSAEIDASALNTIQTIQGRWTCAKS